MSKELEVIVKESGLNVTKAQVILDKFKDYFEIASEWEIKAKAIVVTNESQTAEMEMAKVGRKFLAKKRIDVEKTRKELKEQSLREGKAIDGISNILKALIVPIEEHLKKQEKFMEIKEEAKREQMRIEIEKKIEEERIAKEKAEEEARQRIVLENEKLKKEAEEKEKQAQSEREAHEKELAKERAESEAKQKAQDEILRKEREEALKKQRALEEKARKDSEVKEKEIVVQKAKTKKEAEEKRKLKEQLASQIECPKCHHKFNLKQIVTKIGG